MEFVGVLLYEGDDGLSSVLIPTAAHSRPPPVPVPVPVPVLPATSPSERENEKNSQAACLFSGPLPACQAEFAWK